MEMYKIVEDEVVKLLISDKCKYLFNKKNGFMATWGKTKKDDPDYSPFGPFILDMEISTICNGGCSFCYKSNTISGKNMSLETFKTILHKIPRTLTQVAFGIGSIDANPDLWKIMEYCRTNDYNKVVPNITINGIDFTDEQADNLVRLCGAVAISHYDDDNCYGAVKKLADRGLSQPNIHQLLCQETLEICYKVIDDAEKDERLSGLNAIVFLLMKPKGKRNKFHQLTSLEEYKKLIDYAFDKGVAIGFDSCGCENFLMAVTQREDYKKLEMLAEPCESTLFSTYIDVNGDFFPCSFAENTECFRTGLSVSKCKDFIDDIWNHPETIKFRNKLLDTVNNSQIKCRSCPIYNLKMV